MNTQSPTQEKEAHWQSITDLVKKDADTGLTKTEATILKIKATTVVYHPKDWTEDELDIARNILDCFNGGAK